MATRSIVYAVLVAVLATAPSLIFGPPGLVTLAGFAVVLIAALLASPFRSMPLRIATIGASAGAVQLADILLTPRPRLPGGPAAVYVVGPYWPSIAIAVVWVSIAALLAEAILMLAGRFAPSPHSR